MTEPENKNPKPSAPAVRARDPMTQDEIASALHASGHHCPKCFNAGYDAADKRGQAERDRLTRINRGLLATLRQIIRLAESEGIK
jgi:hypothetical protein